METNPMIISKKYLKKVIIFNKQTGLQKYNLKLRIENWVAEGLRANGVRRVEIYKAKPPNEVSL